MELFDEQQIPLDWTQATLRLAGVLTRKGSLWEGRRLLGEVIPVLEAETARMIYRRLH